MATSPPSTHSVGVSVPRTDGTAKVTGSARYIDDLPGMPGEIFGRTLRSTVPRGVLRGIRLDPSFDWSDVTVVEARDIPVNAILMISEEQPVLAEGKILHAYEPVALIACPDRLKLDRAARAITLDIEPLPAILDIDTALAGKDVIWGEDNVFKRYLITKGRGDAEGRAASEAGIDAALAACDVVVSGRYETHHQEQLYIEPQGFVAFWDDAGVHVTGSLQCPYYVHKVLKRALDLSSERVHVTQAVTGGGFGGKEEYPSIIALHAALLARKSRRPVRMIYDRTEDIEATTKRHPAIVEITTGCDRDGTLRALKARILMDGGAYMTLTPVVLSRGTLHAAGAYRWQDAFIESVAVATNTPPNGAFRGFGAPQTIWAIERHMDRIARAIGKDPVALRAQNLLRSGDTTATGQTLGLSVGGHACLEAALAESGYHEKRAAGPAVNGRVARGIGASVFMHGAGFTGSGERMLKGKVAIDLLPGGRLQIRTASTDIGQGTETVFRQIAADAAGIPVTHVDFAVPSTTVVPDSGPTVASRTVMVVGAIVEGASREIAERVLAEQAAGGGSFTEAGDRLLSREREVSCLKVYEPPSFIQWDDTTYKGDAYPCFAWACDIAEVEVDLDTFEVTVKNFWSATDVGKAIHPVMCKGQIEGGTLQAIGWALCEEVVWKEGLIKNPRMTNYIIPTSLDAPPFHTTLIEEPWPYGPGGGAKGIGELPMDGGAPALAAAIEHATGLIADSLPMTPERLHTLARTA
ncbi:xanthine dehydrogenase family protein molybdopterin-binding subunit [Chondromyces apiculatus]|uniref:Xanthine dehydrogenase, molybdenum binding subunit n=1 Tax=Chondromyces apiculatus DSM 436 TaxID=1192034 RepID=A0A017TJH5_9BACT|nr:xanthine dehydrogenase family protein molybdopterin-binding subunit [Chondromyces apiculatus]EYF08990.1 Xanthine dehydrogenase, molybdenum binding subunit [Chondromyces apiculatus DSM 436]